VKATSPVPARRAPRFQMALERAGSGRGDAYQFTTLVTQIPHILNGGKRLYIIIINARTARIRTANLAAKEIVQRNRTELAAREMGKIKYPKLEQYDGDWRRGLLTI
jgi:hypothetical protein